MARGSRRRSRRSPRRRLPDLLRRAAVRGPQRVGHVAARTPRLRPQRPFPAPRSLCPPRLRPVLGSPDEIGEWVAFENATGWTGGAAIHVDTGMTRLGLHMDEVGADAARPRAVSLVMSHFACADEPGHPLNARQVEAFAAARRHFPGVAGVALQLVRPVPRPGSRFDLVRPGVALYGGNPTPGRDNPMRPVVGLEARIVRVRQAAAGETIGYGATHRFDRPSRDGGGRPRLWRRAPAGGLPSGPFRRRRDGDRRAAVQGRRTRLDGPHGARRDGCPGRGRARGRGGGHRADHAARGGRRPLGDGRLRGSHRPRRTLSSPFHRLRGGSCWIIWALR